MLLKRFFYVSAGFLCLSVSYHLGASQAVAQFGGIQGASIERGAGGTALTAVSGRTFWYWGLPGTSGPPPPGPLSLPAPIPGTDDVVATGMADGPMSVMLANGDVYIWGQTGWDYYGNLVGDATAVTRATWGGVKAKYR